MNRVVMLPHTMPVDGFVEATAKSLLRNEAVFPVPLGMPEHKAQQLYSVFTGLTDRVSGVLFATSGTVGKSKLISRSLENIDEEALGVGAAIGLNPTSKVLITSPITHSYGFGMLMACAMANATAVTLTEENVFARVLQARRLLQNEYFDVITGVPFMFRRLLRSPFRLPFSTVSYAGGETVPNQLRWKWLEVTGAPLYQEYGLSEAGIVSFSKHSDPGISIGKPVPGCAVLLDNGELVVHRKANPTRYLLGDSQETFKDGGIYTGDFGHDDAEGLLYLVGRKKSIVIVAGMKIVPEEVEDAIRRVHDVEDVVVMGEEREGQETRLVAYVAPAMTDLEIAKLVRWLKEELDPYKIPKIVASSELPRTSAGKVDRNALR